MEGWIKIHRKILENPISYSIELLWLMIFLLAKATHSKQSFYLWINKISLKPWQLVTSQRKIADHFWMPISKIHRLIKVLSKEWILKHEWNTKYTVITFENRDKYQTSETPVKHQWNANETKKETNKNDKNEEEWKEKNIISKDIKPKVYGDPEVNELLDIIKSFNNWICDWTQKDQRQYWKHLLNKLKKVDKIQSNEHTRSQYIEWLLWVVINNEYHRHKIWWPKKIYYNLAELIQIANQTMKKQSANTIPFIPWV